MITRAHVFRDVAGSVIVCAMTALTVGIVGMPSAQAGDCTHFKVSATAQAEALRVQSVQRAQAQLGYRQLYTETHQDYVAATAMTTHRYATINDQIAQLGAMIAASKAKMPPEEILLDP